MATATVEGEKVYTVPDLVDRYDGKVSPHMIRRVIDRLNLSRTGRRCRVVFECDLHTIDTGITAAGYLDLAERRSRASK